VTFYNPSKITIGNNVYFAQGCWFSANQEISIRDNILFGPYVVVVTSNHSLKNGAYFFGEPRDKKPVVFKDGCWIGAHSTILSGTVIEQGVLIGANSVIYCSTEKNGIYGGVPAKLMHYANTK